LAHGNNQFAWELYRQVQGVKGNLFLSPYSISTALAMTATGARGKTAEEMTRVLHLGNDPAKYAGQFQQLQVSLLDQPKGYELRIANAIWGQVGYPFKAEFIAGLREHFRAEAQSLRFARDPERSRATINAWVEEATKHKIQELLPPGIIDTDTRLVLTNAIYFKGKWAKPFEKSLTHPADFFVGATELAKVDMMRSTQHLGYAENDALQLVELPYEGSRLAMVVVLPRKKDGVDRVEAGMTDRQIDVLLRSLRRRRVDVSLPRSKVTGNFQLKPALTALGMGRAFTAGQADFSGMDGGRELVIGEVVHKAYCEVNEEGTEAAASSGVVMKRVAAPLPEEPVVFKADHPYLYMIRDTQTGSLLFLGRMTDPRS